MRVVNQHRRTVRQATMLVCQRYRDWDEADEEKQGIDSKDKLKHIERNDISYSSPAG